MSWKVFALLESSFGVLLSVLGIILSAFVLTAGSGDGTTRLLAWGGIVAAIALTLVSHGQLIGTFRRKPRPAEPRPERSVLPALILVVLVVDVALVQLAGSAAWASVARVYLTYFLGPPAALALVSRALVVWSIRRRSDPSRI